MKEEEAHLHALSLLQLQYPMYGHNNPRFFYVVIVIIYMKSLPLFIIPYVIVFGDVHLKNNFTRLSIL